MVKDDGGDDHDNVAAGIDDEDDDDNDVHLTFSCFSFPFDDSPARRQSSPLAVSPDKTIIVLTVVKHLDLIITWYKAIITKQKW